MGVVKAYAKNIDRIEADEALRSIGVQQAANGNMGKSERQAFVRKLEKLRDADRKRRPVTPQRLAAAGIPVEVVARNG